MGPPSLPYAGIGYLRRKSREGRTMSVGPVNNGQGFAHQGNLPGNEGNGEPQATSGDGPRNARANGNNGNGNTPDGVHGNTSNGPSPRGNNPTSHGGGTQEDPGTQRKPGNPRNEGAAANNTDK